MVKLYDTVKHLLEYNPILRDSDRLLIWIVYRDSGYVVDDVMTKDAFLKAPHPESIRRVRQKLQEYYPHLRSSKPVQARKNQKQREKGTFVYREKIILNKEPEWTKDGRAIIK